MTLGEIYAIYDTVTAPERAKNDDIAELYDWLQELKEQENG